MDPLKKDKKELTDKAKKLYKKLKAADKVYYNSDRPLMSDKKYDQLRDKLEVMAKALRRIDPFSKAVAKLEKYLKEEVGAEPTNKAGAKVKLPFKVGSLNKVKTDEPKKLTKFLKRFQKAKRYLLSPKLDGSSLLLKYREGKLIGGFSRGRDNVGTDVTPHVMLLADLGIIPKRLKLPGISSGKGTRAFTKGFSKIKTPMLKKIESGVLNWIKSKKEVVYIRGELQISEKVFAKKWKDKKVKIKGEKKPVEFRESRNAANGFINRKKLIKKFAADLTFFAYGLLTPNGDEFPNALNSKLVNVLLLRAFRFTTYLIGPTELVRTSDTKELQGHLDEHLSKVKNFEYKCDGVVAEVDEIPLRVHTGKGHVEYMFAYKVSTKDLANQEVRITTVKEVEWNTSKSGALKPTVWYEPVKFGNTTNQKANGVNAANIDRLGIGKGTQLKIVRGGDVIPQISSSNPKTRVKKPIPKKCPCGNKVIRPIRTKKGIEEPMPDIYCSKPGKCKFLALKRLVSAIKCLKIKGISEAKLQPLFDIGYTDVLKLSKAKAGKIAKLKGFTEKSANKIIGDLNKGLRNASLGRLAAASGVFVEPGFALAEKRLTALVKKVGEKKILKASESKLRKAIGKDGAELECFVKHHSEFVDFVKKVRSL